jgi:hypothetical protein
LLGSIPFAIKKKVELKTLPFHDEITDQQGKKYMYQGNLDDKNQPKGLGVKWSETVFEFGVYGEAPKCVTRLKIDSDEIVIIPNYEKPMRTTICSNGVLH